MLDVTTNLNKRYKKVTLRPFVFMTTSMTTELVSFFCLLLPQLIMLAITKSYASLVIAASAAAGSVMAAVLSCLINGKFNYSFYMTLIQGLITGLLIPSSYAPVIVFLVTGIVFLLYKYIFKEFSSSWINPIALTIAVAWFINPSFFPAYQLSANDIMSQNASLLLIQRGIFPVSGFDGAVTDFLNRFVFNHLGTSIPAGYVSLFWDTHSIIPAFRFNFLTLLSSLVVFSFNIVRPLISFSYIIVYAALVKIFAPVFFGGVFFQGDILLAILTSGTFFCALFVLPLMSTVPQTYTGSVVYGAFAGVLAFFIIGSGTSSVGSVFTVLAANMISPVIQVLENRAAILHLKKITMKNESTNSIGVTNG
jgi:electron transport complex protein RnfD